VLDLLRSPEEIAKRIVANFPEASAELRTANRLDITAPVSTLLEVASFLRSEGFDHVTSVTGIDYPQLGLIKVVYHVSAYAEPAMRSLVLSLISNVPRGDANMPSLISIWPSAEYHERETHEMIGVCFQGHPSMNLLLLPEDWNDIPPLRKDFRLRGR